MSLKSSRRSSRSVRLQTVEHYLTAAVMTGGILAAQVLGVAAKQNSLPVSVTANASGQVVSVKKGNSNTDRVVADRLKERLHSAAGVQVDANGAIELARQRQNLLQKWTTLHITKPTGTGAHDLSISVSAHPEWIVMDSSVNPPRVRLNEQHIRAFIANETAAFGNVTSTCVISRIERDAYDVKRATTDCIAKDGLSLDLEDALSRVMSSLEGNLRDVSIQLTEHKAQLINQSGEDLGSLVLLSEGTSNFHGSHPAGRIKNIHKAIEEKINNVVIPADSEFSFNQLLGPAVSQGNGWSMGLAIFEGGALRPAPGGGICQTSTTVYRAMLKAGLPLVFARNHSLYVHYYEDASVGLDAAVFYNQQDMKFRNDTGHPIFMQAYITGEDVTVRLYGTPDERAITLTGPYFNTNAPADVTVHNRAVRANEIVWLRTVTRADGTVMSDQINSRYKAVPNAIKTKYPTVTQNLALR